MIQKPPKTPETAPKHKLPPEDPADENVVRRELQKGDVRPDGPGDETAPVEPTKRQTQA